MRLILVLAALSMLSACNVVMTTKPLLSKLDAFGAPQLRPGIWDKPPSDSCVFDEKTSMKTWPSCAQGSIVAPFKLSGYDDKEGTKTFQSLDYVLGWGKPQLMQVFVAGDASQGLPMAVYVYAGVNPTKLDEQGRIVAYESWLVMCGPPPSPDAKGANGMPKGGTDQPLPGLVMDSSGSNCSSDTKAAVRNAAGPSRAWSKDVSAEHWVRDGQD